MSDTSSSNAKTAHIAAAGALANANTWSLRGIDRRTFITSMIGASVGFGIGISCHIVWRTISGLFGGNRSDQDQLIKLSHQLTSLKNELNDMRNTLRSVSHRAPREKLAYEAQPFFLSENDDSDEFFDIESIVSSDNEYGSAGSGHRPNSGPASSSNHYQTASEGLSRKYSATRLGPAVPEEITMELDRLADFAMGEWCSSTPKISPGGDELSPGMQAYAKCLVYKRKYRRSPEFLWRFARATYLASNDAIEEDDPNLVDIQDDGAASDVGSLVSSRTYDPNSSPNDRAYEFYTRRQFVQTGLATARKAIYLAKIASSQNDPSKDDDFIQLAQMYKWLAVMVGLASEYTSVQQRIRYGFEFKELIDKSIALDPSDWLSFYLKGRWCYQVYNLSWVERQFASRLFATPPSATIEEAEAALEQSERLRPEFSAANQLYLAKCCISRSDYKKAVDWLISARRLAELNRSPQPHTDSSSIRDEIESLYLKYSAY